MRFFLIILAFIALPSYGQKIKPDSGIAKVFRDIGGHPQYAVTIGKTIYVSVTLNEFLEDTAWVKHEMKHVEQCKRYGTIGFLQRYIFYWILHGYKKNKFEIEAFKAEKE